MSITVQLAGQVSSIVPVTNTWTDVGATGHVTFTDLHSVTTTAVINAAGIYTLRLTSVTDGGLSAHDDMIVNTQLNQQPVANAGADFAAVTSQPYQLNGSATDDAYPDANSPPNHLPHTLNYTWSKVSGSGTVTFSPSSDGGTTSNVSNPTVTFGTGAPTTYVLRLSVSDTKAAPGTDTVTATVSTLPGTHYVSATAVNPSATLGGTSVEYRVDLSIAGAPSGNAWWTNMVGSAGEDIRVTDASNNPLPFDVIGCNKSARTGLLVYKAPVGATGAAVRIWNGRTPAVRLSPTDTYGQYNAYRTDCLAFYPDGGGSGTSNRTQYTSNFLSVVGFPTVTTGSLGAIGSDYTLYSFGKYCYRTRSGFAFHSPITFSGAVGVALSGSQVAWLGGVASTNNGLTDSTKNSLYVKGVLSGGSQTLLVGEQGDFATPVPEATTTTTASAGFYHYSGTVASTGNSRTATSQLTTNTNSTALASFHSNQYDHLVIGARPRLSPSSAAEFCSTNTPICLVTLYSSELGLTHLKYQGLMLDQGTMFPSWTYT